VSDYVRVIRDNPRYSAALNTGSDVHAFANALQRGGFATDPEYAKKLIAVADSLFKPDGSEPIPAREPSRMNDA
jgi:flagellar protein FlgJ